MRNLPCGSSQYDGEKIRSAQCPEKQGRKSYFKEEGEFVSKAATAKGSSQIKTPSHPLDLATRSVVTLRAELFLRNGGGGSQIAGAEQGSGNSPFKNVGCEGEREKDIGLKESFLLFQR